jgi:hypothetical protein
MVRVTLYMIQDISKKDKKALPSEIFLGERDGVMMAKPYIERNGITNTPVWCHNKVAFLACWSYSACICSREWHTIAHSLRFLS